MSNPTNAAKPTVDAILANPQEFGLSPVTVTRKKKGLELPPVPVFDHIDVTKITNTFGEAYWLATANGTSWRVRDDRVAREMKYKDHGVTDEAIMRRQIEARFGVRAPRTAAPQFKGMDGKTYATELEMKQANIARMVEMGVPAEQAIKIAG